jgi:hypothetical protein
MEEVGKKPNWLLIREAAEALYRSGKVYFTRKDLIEEVKKKDPSRSNESLEYDIELSVESTHYTTRKSMGNSRSTLEHRD